MMNDRPYVVITEQPHPKALRSSSLTAVHGASSTPERLTWPSIALAGYQGRAVVVVSCVTKDAPYLPHPHRLVGGTSGYRHGVFTGEFDTNMTCTFRNMSIEGTLNCVIVRELQTRQELRVDPFRSGFPHISQPDDIDLKAVRLCFQVFLQNAQSGRFTEPLTPVVSDVICDEQ